MPLLADAIVECGRRTLRNAIKLANGWGADKQGKWFGARVVYGEYVFLYLFLNILGVSPDFQNTFFRRYGLNIYQASGEKRKRSFRVW